MEITIKLWKYSLRFSLFLTHWAMPIRNLLRLDLQKEIVMNNSMLTYKTFVFFYIGGLWRKNWKMVKLTVLNKNVILSHRNRDLST